MSRKKNKLTWQDPSAQLNGIDNTVQQVIHHDHDWYFVGSSWDGAVYRCLVCRKTETRH